MSAVLQRMPRGPQAAADRHRRARPHRVVRRGIAHATGGMDAVAVLATGSHGSGAKAESRVRLDQPPRDSVRPAVKTVPPVPTVARNPVATRVGTVDPQLVKVVQKVALTVVLRDPIVAPIAVPTGGAMGEPMPETTGEAMDEATDAGRSGVIPARVSVPMGVRSSAPKVRRAIHDRASPRSVLRIARCPIGVPAETRLAAVAPTAWIQHLEHLSRDMQAPRPRAGTTVQRPVLDRRLRFRQTTMGRRAI